MTNKEAMEFFASLFNERLAIAQTNNIGGVTVELGFTASMYVAGSNVSFTATVWGPGNFEAALVFPNGLMRGNADTNKRGFKEFCKAFKAAYYEYRLNEGQR